MSNDGPGQPFRNAAAVLEQGQPIRRVYKSLLPTYDVFDEDRYFEPATSTRPVTIGGRKIGITICEDIWTEKYLPRRLYGSSPVASLIEQGAELIVNLSASPFTVDKAARRHEMLSGIAAHARVPIFYCNSVGGNDQLIFDGNSLAVGRRGSSWRACRPLPKRWRWWIPTGRRSCPRFPTEPEQLHGALTLGVRDYLHKCGFKSAVLGLSGGIDSAIVACLAADALGPENVLGVTMPTRYSSTGQRRGFALAGDPAGHSLSGDSDPARVRGGAGAVPARSSPACRKTRRRKTCSRGCAGSR